MYHVNVQLRMLLEADSSLRILERKAKSSSGTLEDRSAYISALKRVHGSIEAYEWFLVERDFKDLQEFYKETNYEVSRSGVIGFNKKYNIFNFLIVPDNLLSPYKHFGNVHVLFHYPNEEEMLAGNFVEKISIFENRPRLKHQYRRDEDAVHNISIHSQIVAEVKKHFKGKKEITHK